MRLFSLSRPHQTARLLLWLLLPALLLAQWVGQSHRIAHAGWINGKPAYNLTVNAVENQAAATAFEIFSPPFGDDKQLHSCAFLDALTAADYLHTAALPLPDLAGNAVLSDLPAQQSWLAPLLLHFSSRAPPLLLS
ncbi:hypothetical protein LPB67_14535 [Undibacterium sp. Jales W-56]|uniref:hypothetical protein n=1 Tax=Undibacterium sp. Jales W-56 TaxID=2897325 RepID=UPI0021D1F490|nr:hypothetical protein [Undibacterium sp. Jales W-56]MCU6434991.1 hypothetical protein [Undibacterium sp. Jales W-56]